MTEEEFKDRNKQIALRTIKLVDALPKNYSSQVIGRQLLRPATSVGANYRAACRAKSTADLINKLSIAREEADESLYWMELLAESKPMPEKKLVSLRNDMNEIVAMTVSSIKTLRLKKQSKIQNPKSKI